MASVKKFLQKIRVPAGFVAAAVFFIISRPGWLVFWLGLPVAVLGAATRFWAAGHIRKSREITISGPYRFTRNPLYLGSFLIGLGLAVQSGLLILPPLFVILFFCVYYPVMRQEEHELASVFGDEFHNYRARVPLFLPSVRKAAADPRAFSLEQALRNHEYNAPAGVLAVELVLIAKILWPRVLSWPIFPS